MLFIDSVKVGDYIKWRHPGLGHNWDKVAHITTTQVVTATGARFSPTGKLYGHDIYASIATLKDVEMLKVMAKRTRFTMYCYHLTDEEFLKVYEFAVKLRLDRYEEPCDE